MLGSHLRVDITKRNDLDQLEVMPKHWRVERNFVSPERNRHLSKPYVRKPPPLQFVHLEF